MKLFHFIDRYYRKISLILPAFLNVSVKVLFYKPHIQTLLCHGRQCCLVESSLFSKACLTLLGSLNQVVKLKVYNVLFFVLFSDPHLFNALNVLLKHPSLIKHPLCIFKIYLSPTSSSISLSTSGLSCMTTNWKMSMNISRSEVLSLISLWKSVNFGIYFLLIY